MTGPRIFLAAVLQCSAAVGVWGQASKKPEYLVKAEYMAYVGQASRFWKGGDGGPSEGPFQIGVIGRSPFEGNLNQVCEKRTIQGRPVKVLYPRSADEASSCQMIFVCRSEADRLEEVLGWVKGRSVITVGDSKGFLARGIMVNFALEHERIVIWVSPETAKKGGVSFAPDFLALVKIYSGKEGS
jgi:hypothetical protein